MKYWIEAEMITGTKHMSIATEIDDHLLKLFYNMDNASHIQLPITESDCVILNPKHVVSLRLTEVME